MPIAGLHSCKPGNEPVVGHVKSFVIIQNPATETKKGWTKIKAASADQGGQPYAITSVKPTGFTDSYGNISFNLEIEPQNGAQSTQDGVQRTSGPPIARTQGAMSRDDYWARKEDRDREWQAEQIRRQPRIDRMHAHKVTIAYMELKGLKNLSFPEIITLIDWWQRDIGRSPTKPVVESEGQPGDPAEYGDGPTGEPPF